VLQETFQKARGHEVFCKLRDGAADSLSKKNTGGRERKKQGQSEEKRVE